MTRGALILVLIAATGVPLMWGQPPGDVAPIPIDDTARVQGFIDRDEVIPAGTYWFAGQLVCRDGHGIHGHGPQRTRLHYTGEPRADGAILIAASSWDYSMGRFSLANMGRKSGVGITAGADTGSSVEGTQSGCAVWSQVSVNGFERGVQFGGPDGRSTSELTITSLATLHCDVGVYAQSWNTLNINLNQLLAYKCRVGVECKEAHAVHVNGGSATDVGTMFKFSQGGTYSVTNYRTEGVGRLAEIATTTANVNVRFDSCLTQGMPPGDGIDVFAMWGASVSMRACSLAGKIVYDSYPPTDRPIGYGTVCLENVWTLAPVLLEGRRNVRARYDIRGSGTLDSGGQVKGRVSGKGIIGAGPIPVER